MSRSLQIITVFLLIMFVLGLGIQKAGLAGVFSDRLSRLYAQDETTYASAAVSLVTGSGWMTPTVLGRFYLVKPPLLIWLAGLSMRTLGISRFALRFPVLLAAALATLFLFLWSERRYSRWIAVITLLLAVGNPLWYTFSRICYTDMLLVFAMTGALWTFDRDPELAQTRSVLLFGGFLAAGTMTKNVAGLLPVAVVVSTCLVSRHRPPVGNLLKCCLVTTVLIAPWHLYQSISHPRWFWTDYVQIQLLQFGFEPPAQPSKDGAVWFYLKRFALIDPVLALLSAFALPSLVWAVRAGKREAALLLSWIAVACGALLLFHYRNLPYLLYAIPPLCIAAAAYAIPRLTRYPKFAAIALAAVFCFKAASGSHVWGLPSASAASIPSEKWFRWYAKLQRPNNLIAVNSDDEFYASALPIAKIHYCNLDPGQLTCRYAPHYAYLGITVTVDQFNNMEDWEPRFKERLQAWGLPTTSPIATNIMAATVDEIVRLVETHEQTDFYLPADIIRVMPPATLSTRRVMPLSQDRYFVLAPEAHDSHFSQLRWSVPQNW
jgi:hypothetical protein